MKLTRFATVLALGLIAAACAQEEEPVPETVPPPAAPAPPPPADTGMMADSTHMMDSTATTTH